MSCTKDLIPMKFDLTMLSAAEWSFTWEDHWHPSTGVTAVDFLADVRNVALGASATIAIKPALQFAYVRTDRPDQGAVIAIGSSIDSVGPTHYAQSITSTQKFFFRRGLGFKLTAGSFARAEVLLYTSFRACGKIFPPREIIYNPYNEDVEISMFPLTGPFSAVGVDKVKLAIIGMDNANNKLEYQVFARAFNDPLARGGWTGIQSDVYTATTAGDFVANTDELPFTGLTLANSQWVEVAIGLKKDATADANSRVILHITSAIKYA